MKIIVNTNGDITITCPMMTPKYKTAQFVEKNAEWIRQTLLNCKKQDYITEFKTKDRVLTIEYHDQQKMTASFTNDKILVKLPENTDIKTAEVQRFLYRVIVAALKDEGRRYLPSIVENLAKKNNIKYSGLTIGSATSAWGTCYSNGKITLSCFVMILPYHLVELVILHELTHTLYLDHSAAFHNKLNMMLPNHNEKELNEQLKNYRIIKPK